MWLWIDSCWMNGKKLLIQTCIARRLRKTGERGLLNYTAMGCATFVLRHINNNAGRRYIIWRRGWQCTRCSPWTFRKMRMQNLLIVFVLPHISTLISICKRDTHIKRPIKLCTRFSCLFWSCAWFINQSAKDGETNYWFFHCSLWQFE